jgi:hypothetical protein
MNGAAALATEPLPERVYAYDHTLYDRRFLNCCQRHAVVFLNERGVPIDLLFFRALVPSDLIMTQILLENRPKYAITTDYFSPEDLALLGVTIHEHAAENFGDIRPVALAHINRTGFALLAGDVFHFPHCPEYRISHGEHVVVLRGCNGHVWSIVDDNHASILCEYEYPEHSVRNFFENNGARILRTRIAENSTTRSKPSWKIRWPPPRSNTARCTIASPFSPGPATASRNTWRLATRLKRPLHRRGRLLKLAWC